MSQASVETIDVLESDRLSSEWSLSGCDLREPGRRGTRALVSRPRTGCIFLTGMQTDSPVEVSHETAPCTISLMETLEVWRRRQN